MPSPLNHLLWIEELLPEDVIPKKMHDGMGYYLDEKLVLLLIEASKSRVYRGRDYPFQIWNGCFFPIDKLKQNTVIGKFLFLENHPALKNALYLPAENEDFADNAKQVLREIKKRNPLFGQYIKIKKPEKVEMTEAAEDDDFSKPSLFSDAPAPSKQVAKKPKSSPKLDLAPNKKKTKANKKPENSFLLNILKKKS